ncbi:Lmo0850 family protein [Rummeliibacillus pycnus]
MSRDVDVTKIIANLSKLGVKATTTKSRLELLKALAPPKSAPQTQTQN